MYPGELVGHMRMVHGRCAGKDVYAHHCDVCGNRVSDTVWKSTGNLASPGNFLV